MKLFLLLSLLTPLAVLAQDSTAVAAPRDTTIYDFADEAARFPSPCERLDTTAAARAECAQSFLLEYVNSKIIYPPEARERGTSGTAVVSFIVEANGLINRPTVLRDPGDGTGRAALLAVAVMQREVRWRPAVRDGAFVRSRFVLPVRFRITDPVPYTVSGRDTIYTELTRSVAFVGNGGRLTDYLDERLDYPGSGEDSCRIGQLDVQLLVEPGGGVRVQDIIDYNGLGVDFTSEAIDVVTGSFGQWRPGEYDGRPVLAAYDVTFTFVPEGPACASTVTDYTAASQELSEGQALLADSTMLAAGLAKLDAAVARFPRDGRFRIVRGQARLDANQLGGACEDFREARRIALVDWYDAVLPVLCREE